MSEQPDIAALVYDALVWGTPGSVAARVQRRKADQLTAKIQQAVDAAAKDAARQALVDAANDPAMSGDWRHFGHWLAQRAARLYPKTPS